MRYTHNMPYIDKILARVKESTSAGTVLVGWDST
jgi:hypothetical protein